jgi:hypothetical protein
MKRLNQSFFGLSLGLIERVKKGLKPRLISKLLPGDKTRKQLKQLKGASKTVETFKIF